MKPAAVVAAPQDVTIASVPAFAKGFATQGDPVQLFAIQPAPSFAKAVGGAVTVSAVGLFVENVSVAIVVTVTSTDVQPVNDVSITPYSAFAKAFMTAHGDWEIVTSRDVSLEPRPAFAKAIATPAAIIAEPQAATINARSGFAKAFAINHDPVQTFAIQPAPAFAKAVSKPAVVNASSGQDYDETGLLVSIVTTTSSVDLAAFTDDLLVEINTTVTSWDNQPAAGTENTFVHIVATISSYDGFNVTYGPVTGAITPLSTGMPSANPDAPYSRINGTQDGGGTAVAPRRSSSIEA